MFRVAVAGGEGTHGCKAAHPHRRDCSLSPAGDHYVCIVPLNGAKGVAHGMCTGGASRRRCLVGAERSITDAYLAGGQIHDGPRNEKW